MDTYAIVNDDYAVLKLPDGTRFYYGYEVTDGDEWCFEATSPNTPAVKIPFSKLGIKKRNQFADMAECLLMGIGRVMEEQRLKT